MFNKHWILQDSEQGGEGGGSGGGSGDPAPADSAPAAEGAPSNPSPDTTVPGTAPAEPTAPIKPASALARANEDTSAKFFHSPEKHRVLKEDGSLDVEATLANTAKAYGSLEKQLGASKGAPPNAPGDYKIEAPEALKDVFQPEDAGFQTFLTEAHKAGMSQHQVDTVMKAYFDWVPKIVSGAVELSVEECNTALAERWPDPAEARRNYVNADRALKAFAGEGYGELEAEFGNNPKFIALMAEIGKQLREDRPPGGAAPGGSGRSQLDIVKDLSSPDAAVREKAQLEMQKFSEGRAKEIGPLRP